MSRHEYKTRVAQLVTDINLFMAEERRATRENTQELVRMALEQGYLNGYADSMGWTFMLPTYLSADLDESRHYNDPGYDELKG